MIFLWHITVYNLIVLTGAILLMIVLLVCTVMLFSYFRNKRIAKQHKWQSSINEAISNAVINNQVEKDQAIERNMVFRAFRNLFLDELVASEQKFAGAAFQYIKELFQLYGLEPFVLSKLKSRKVYVVAKGIRELRAMKVESAIPEIQARLQHKAPEIYLEAQYAMVYLRGFEGLSFLNNLKHLISDWQQLKLLTSIKSIPADAVQNVAKWLQSENESVVIFALRIIRKFQLLDFIDSLMLLIESGSTAVRLQAVKSLDMLEGDETSLHLRSIFKNQPYLVQIEIVKLLQKLRNKEDKGFFVELLSAEVSNTVKVLAAEALVNWGFREELIRIAQERELSNELSLIIKHALREEVC